MGEPGQPLPPCPHCRAAHSEDLLICPNTNRLLPLEGRLIDGRFRFVRKLGEGGMSTVWMAENFRVRKRVAIKLMHPEYARNPRTLHRFQNEATAAGRIGNPHICDILDFGESPLGPYIVMEMLQGQSFAELLDDHERIDPPLAVLIICEALKGLAAAHAVGIIHRDLKPENMFLHEPEPGRMLVKLMDFGISKFTEDPGGGRTGANVVMGTPEYMSPEQAAGAANVDAGTDIWAMGVMLYRAISGIEPFRGKTMAALLLALSMEEPEPLTKHVPNLPPGLVAVIHRCMAKKPQQRLASADELYRALAPFQQAVVEGERPVAPVRTGSTMSPGSFSLAASPANPAPTSAPQSAPQIPGQTVNVSAPTGPVATLHPNVVHNRAHPNPGANQSIEQRLPAARSSDESPTGSNPAAQQNGAGTWSSDLPNLVGADQSWSMGKRTFNDDYDRSQRRRRSGGGWLGWVIGVGVVGLLGGGVGLAWSLGAFDAGGTGESDASGDESGVLAGGTSGLAGSVDLPAGDGTEGGLAGTSGTGETGGESGTETGAIEDDGGGETSTEDDASSDGGGSGGSGGGSGGSGGGSGGSGGGSGGSGGGSGGSGGGSGGDTKPKDPPFQPNMLVKSGIVYTTKSRGPQGTWAQIKNYCRKLDRQKKYGLSRWRMATVNEIKKFRSTGISKLLYWSRDTEGGKAKAVMLLSGKVDSRDLDSRTPRAFCVSRR